MVNYMVAVDGSPTSEIAFYTAVHMLNKASDKLHVLCVIQHEPNLFGLDSKSKYKVKEKAQLNARTLLRAYGEYCRSNGILYHCIIAVSNHTGSMIVREAEERYIDYLILGRRGLSKMKRVVTGSTSRFVVENAPCNILIIKGEPAPLEVHADKKAVLAAEEEERRRRIEEEQGRKKVSEFQEQLNRNISRLAEEAERERRIKEEEAIKEKEAKDREAAHIGAVISEEEERKRREWEDRIIDDRTHRVSLDEKEEYF